MDKQSSITPAIGEEDDANIGLFYQPEVFLVAKTVHIRFVNLLVQLKQELKGCDHHKFLDIVGQLTFLPSDYLEDLRNACTEEVFDRVGFLWSWNDHSILRAVLEATNCQRGIEMLDKFESQIDATQPMELFPIPPPSIKMAPFPSSAFTVLSVRVEYNKDEPVPLQYVNDVATIMNEKFEITSHALQLLAARTNPLMLYWMIPKSIVPLVNKGVNEHSNFFKENGFSEIALFPSTILYATDHLTNGSFALLSIQQQVSKNILGYAPAIVLVCFLFFIHACMFFPVCVCIVVPCVNGCPVCADPYKNLGCV